MYSRFQLTLLGLVVVVGLFMAAFAIVGGLDLAQAQSTNSAPSFEVATSSLPVLTGQGVTLSPSQVEQNEVVRITVEAYDVSGLSSAVAYVRNSVPGSRPVADVPLFDDGQHSDGLSGDGKFSGTWNVGSNADGLYPVEIQVKDRLNNTATMNVVTIAVGVGACASDSQCAAGSRCCGGVCASDQCVSNSQCNDNNVGTSDTCITSSCPAFCSNIPITQCANNDGFCPSSCTSSNDSDCGDASAPEVSFVYPNNENDSITTSPYQVVADAIDPQSGIDRVEFYLDGETTPRDVQYFDSPAGSERYYWVMNAASIPNGSHLLTVKAFNGVSLSTTITRNVQISITSSTPFNVLITSPVAGSSFSNSTIFPVTVTAQDDQSVTEVRVFSSAGGSALASVVSSGTSINVQLNVNAGLIARGNDPFQYLVQEEKNRNPLPFISVAKAADDGTGCTTTTTNYPKSIYAVAYDAQGNFTPSSLLNIIVVRTTTTCTNTNSATQTTTNPST